MTKTDTCILSFLLFLLFIYPLKGQKNSKQEEKAEFQRLENLIKTEKEKDVALEYSKRYIALAKLHHESDLLYNGYIFAAEHSTDSLALKYSDSLILHTAKTKNNRYIGLAYSTAAATALRALDHKKAIDLAIIADEYLKNDDSKEYGYDGMISIGKLKDLIGDYTGANAIWSEMYKYYSWKIKQKVSNENNISYQYALLKLIKTNSSLKKFQDNIHLLQQAYSLDNAENEMLNLYIVDGFNDFSQGKYKEALAKFLKASTIKNQERTDRTALLNYYTGICYAKLNLTDKAIPLLKGIIIDFKKYHKTDLGFRPAFNFFTDYYKKNGTVEQQLSSVNDLLEFDKYEKDVHSYVEAKLKEFDEKQKTEEQKISENEENKTQIIDYTILILGTAGIGYYVYKKLKAKKTAIAERSTIQNFKEENERKEERNIKQDYSEEKVNTEVDYNLYRPINKLTVDQIIKSMNIFESSLEFLEQDIKLTVLAQKFNTNEKYLSKVIKIYKDKTFNTYITDLRFDYLDHMLEKDPKFRNQKVKEISVKLGFGSPEFFATAFKEKYGKSPKEYFEI